MVRLLAAESPTARPTLLVVGDIIYDLHLAGTVRDVSSASAAHHAAPIFSSTSRYESLGGAADAAANLLALGNEVRLLGVVGADPAGRRTREMLREQGIADTFCLEDVTRPTTQRTYLLAGDRHVLRVDRESRAPLAAPLTSRLLECVHVLVAGADGIVCVDSDNGVCGPSLLGPLFGAARAARCPVFVDCDGQDMTKYRGATAMLAHCGYTSSVRRANRDSRTDASCAAGPSESAGHLLHWSQVQTLLVACGQDGRTLLSPSEVPLHIPTHAGDGVREQEQVR